MDKVQKIREEVARIQLYTQSDVLKEILDYIDKVQEEPVSEELEEELSKLLKECEVDAEYVHQDFLHIVARHFANWQKEQLMKDAVDGIVYTQLKEGEIMVRSHYFKSESLKYLDEVKMIIVKEN